MNIRGFSINDVLWLGLRNCQKGSIETALSYLKHSLNKDDPKSCLISLPTGAGKSGVIAILAHKATQLRVLVLCHRRAVCDQLYSEINGKFFEERASGQAISQKRVFNNVDDTSHKGIYVSTFQKLQTFGEDDLRQLKENIDLVIIDEGHAEPSPIWNSFVRGMGAHKIVITATPYRNDLFQFDIDDGSSYIYTFEKALEDEILREPKFETIQPNDLSTSINQYLIENPDTKCIIKCNTFRDIETYYELLNEQFNILAVHDRYVGNSRENVKVVVPSNLKESDYQIIIHQRKLDEGVDIPQAKLLVLTYVVNSGRELVQTIGRVVRLFGDIEPKVLEFKHDSNAQMWKNYRYFDHTLNNPESVKKFIASLDTSKLIELYLEAFPDASYYGNRFLRKFDINSFDPDKSLVIPTASVCFLNQSNGFSTELATDVLYWRCNRAGELAKQFDVDGGIKIIVSIAFNKSKFLRDQFFFEPSLEITLVKELEPNIVAIYDSRGRRFNNDSDLKIGTAVAQDQLFKVMALDDSAITKETNSRSINTARKRPEGISMKGKNLEQIANLQNNSSYRISTLRCDTHDRLGTKSGSYYIGVDSGRISDQKENHFTLKDLNVWLSTIEATLSSDNSTQSNLVHSFAKPIAIDTSLQIESVIFDFTELEQPLKVSVEGVEFFLDNSFLYFKYNEGIILEESNPQSLITIKLQEESPFLVLSSEYPLHYLTSIDNELSGDLIDFLTTHLHKALLENGVSYSQDKFFELKLPTEGDFNIINSSLANVVIGMSDLLDPSLDEKGYVGGVIQIIDDDNFSSNSVFSLLDQLKSNSSENPTRSELGPFNQYIPAADLVLCTDMGTEPADFILSSQTKLVYVHVKCGNSSSRPQSSAGALSEVGNQAIKNIEMLISNDTNLKAANWNTLLTKWPRNNAPQTLKERIRLHEGQRFDSNDDDNICEQKLSDLWEDIADRRRSTNVQKEVWLVVANSFSASHFAEQLNSGHGGRGESLQAYQLIQSWMATAHSNDVELKIFVSP